MEDETENVFKEQIGKLPKEVVAFLSSSNWSSDADEIGSLYNLSHEELVAFKREVTLVLAGLVHPDEFKEVLEQEVGIAGAVLDEIVKSVETKIFAPIRPALIEFLKKEDAEKTAEEPVVEKETATAPMEKPRVQITDVAPDNLPVGEEIAPLIPLIPAKAPNLEAEPPSEPAHPFEEKMKKVFTAGQQSMGDLTIGAAAPASVEPQAPPQAPNAPRIYHADPYREPIE